MYKLYYPLPYESDPAHVGSLHAEGDKMSARLFKDDVVFLQRLLKSLGLYTGRIDGIWGPMTDAGVKKFDRRSEALACSLGTFDPRTEKHILSLHLKAQEAARIFMRKMRKARIQARIISGTRTYEEQNKLFRQGRYGNPGKRVTNARGGQSNHNFAIAWDIGIFSGGKYITKAGPYKRAADIGLSEDLIWGGNWRRFRDVPHYQLATGLAIKAVRKKFEKGMPYV